MFISLSSWYWIDSVCHRSWERMSEFCCCCCCCCQRL